MNELEMQDEEFWRQLEWLSLQFISSEIEIKINESELTRKRKDGGFDGQIVINITNNENVCHKILFESKFRASISSLPLDDCSKALIIAFNRAVQTLYLVTNILFSPQAQKEINEFKRKVNLSVIPVDGNVLKTYIAKNRGKLLEGCSEKFLQYIENSPNADLNIKINNFNKKAKKKIVSRKNISIKELENISKEFLYKNNFFKNESEKYIKNIKTIGKFTLLSGEAGIGKTIFLTNTLDTLESYGYSTAIFDLQYDTTPRILFIRLLESLWGIDLSEFISQFDYEEGIENLKSLIEYNSDGKISETLLNAVMQALNKRFEEIKGYIDNYYFLLTKYIYLLLKPYENNNSIVWAFIDLNKASVETLNFLYALLCRIQGIISVIVEMRPNFMLETVSSELVNSDYYIKFKTISSKPYTINFMQFNHFDAQQYLKEYLPNMPEEQLDLIIVKVGMLPLYLNIAANYIKSKLETINMNSKAIPDRILISWISELEKHENSIILNSLSYFRNIPEIDFCFGITGILDGCLPIAIIEKFYTQEQQNVLYNKLDHISFYKFKKDSYYVKHDYIFNAMKNNWSDRFQYDIAKKIYECTKYSDISFKVTDEKIFELQYFMQDYEKALEQWFVLEEKFYREHLFCSIIKYGNIALKCYDNMELEKKKQDVQLKIITVILNAYLQIRILNAERFNQLLLQYETICNLRKYSPTGALLKARYLFYRWNQLFYGANIEDSYRIIVEAKRIVDEKNIGDTILSANIYWAYALSHKRKTSIEQAIEDYKDGLKKYPDSTILRVGLGLHQAHIYIRKQPEKSQKICESILANMKEDDCPYHEILQTRIDIVMSKFYAKQYEKAMEDCEEVLQIARSINASYQIGRLYNIYGAGFLMNGDIENAETNFTRSYNEFWESGNQLFAWRAIFNLSQILLKSGKEKEAIKGFKTLYKDAIPNLKEHIQNLTLENAEMAAFLYTVRILKKKGQYRENKTAKLLRDNEIFSRLSECDDKIFLSSLKQLSYIHKDYLIILG